MRKIPRNSDGTMRRANRPKQLSERTIVARWIEAETLRLKQLGMSYETIAEHIVGVAHGRQRAIVELPEAVEFPADYRISLQAVHRAFARAITRLPNAEAAAHRKLDTARCEDMYFSLQAGIRRGDPKSIDVGVRVLEHKARINDYLVAAKVEVKGGGGAIPIRVIQDAVAALEDEEHK
jgi:hypothetical protein